MAGRNWYAAQCTSGLGRGKWSLSVAAGFVGLIVWLCTTHWGPPSRGANSSHCNDVAFCALPTLLFSSAVLGSTNRSREGSNSRRDNEKKKSVLGIGVGNLFRFVPAAAKALGDGLRNIFWDVQKPKPAPSAGEDVRWATAPVIKDEGAYRDGARRGDEWSVPDAPYLRRGGQRKAPTNGAPRGTAPAAPELQRDLVNGTQNLSMIPLPSLDSYPNTFGIQGAGHPPGSAMPASAVENPSWLFLEGGRLRRVPYAPGDAHTLPHRAHYLPEEGVWTISLPSHREDNERKEEALPVRASPSKGGLDPWLARAHSSSPINLEGVPESLKLLLVFPEEDVLFVDKQAARAIAKAAGTIASSVVNYPSEKSRLLAKTFPADQRFYVIPRKGTTLFDQFGMLPGRFLGEGSFGVVFEGKSSAGVSFAVKVCVQQLWVSMTPAQESKLLNECEASEIRIPELFPQNVDPPTLYYRYRMVVPLLTGHIAHLPPVYPLGKNLYGTQVCALYPSALCDVQQLAQAVSLPPPVQMELTRNMVTVVARLHLLGIVHLDIKLANFLIDQQGRVLLSDFGLAMKKQMFPVMISCRSGSPAFMSPEMIRCLAKHKNADGKIALSSKMDAFSLGVTLYMIWCGVLPFSSAVTGGTVNSLIESLDRVYKDGGHLSFHNCPGRDIPDPEVKAIITEFLRVEPEMRATPLDVVRASTIFLKAL